MRPIILLAFLFCLFACANDDTTKDKAVVVSNTPEAVAQFWLESYFDNQFDAAKKYSSPTTQAMIDTIKNILFTEFEDPAPFKISALRCQTDSLNATCAYIYVEGDERIPEDIQLQNLEGQWLVNAQLIEEE